MQRILGVSGGVPRRKKKKRRSAAGLAAAASYRISLRGHQDEKETQNGIRQGMRGTP